jgi:hypothetical protein
MWCKELAKVRGAVGDEASETSRPKGAGDPFEQVPLSEAFGGLLTAPAYHYID